MSNGKTRYKFEVTWKRTEASSGKVVGMRNVVEKFAPYHHYAKYAKQHDIVVWRLADVIVVVVGNESVKEKSTSQQQQGDEVFVENADSSRFGPVLFLQLVSLPFKSSTLFGYFHNHTKYFTTTPWDRLNLMSIIPSYFNYSHSTAPLGTTTVVTLIRGYRRS